MQFRPVNGLACLAIHSSQRFTWLNNDSSADTLHFSVAMLDLESSMFHGLSDICNNKGHTAAARMRRPCHTPMPWPPTQSGVHR